MATALTLLLTLSTSRQPTGSRAKAISTVLPAADPRRHSAVCCCSLCEQFSTGEQAMRSVGGDYRRFLARVGTIPSSLLSRSRDAAPSLIAVVLLLLSRRSA